MISTESCSVPHTPTGSHHASDDIWPPRNFKRIAQVHEQEVGGGGGTVHKHGGRWEARRKQLLVRDDLVLAKGDLRSAEKELQRQGNNAIPDLQGGARAGARDWWTYMGSTQRRLWPFWDSRYPSLLFLSRTSISTFIVFLTIDFHLYCSSLLHPFPAFHFFHASSRCWWICMGCTHISPGAAGIMSPLLISFALGRAERGGNIDINNIMNVLAI